ncbi:MAG: methionyl-tRNA formyltransferase [Saprospiraceae bacterium]|nr:methionyl-tRNA formyltransferase [Saprospiraceae bacterium]MCF8248830.1 methionyl-tRNA formyltransferase [Saprospiraceae bacterium]MCF8310115.1 methionyl-tRNA formyltransferase [Saprospiraceae bacterium]MCF8439015.1 methionyl-tRNA formyltransferase [Saprospiraceae bacterium]
MGTPDFAVPSLEILLDNGYDVVAVITATDKLGGRGGKTLLESAVKKCAVSRGIPVLQPEKLRSPDFLEQLRSYQADLQVVVAFRMLPEAVWTMPKIGTFNLHGSLLPKYRGAAPINWAIINGEQETGVTTFFLRHEIDTGDLLFQEKMPIGEDETAGEVHDRMMQLGAGLVLKTVQAIGKEDYVLQKQDDAQACHAPKIFHETCEIDFGKSASEVHNFVRGLSPFPGAWKIVAMPLTLEDGTPWHPGSWEKVQGVELKVFRTQKEAVSHSFPIGQFVTDGKKRLKVATADGFVHLLELQLQGRKRLTAVDFLNGLKS